MNSQASCKFCGQLVDPVEMNWGVAYDLITDDSYVYHEECFDETET